MVKNLQCGTPGFSPWVGKIPWRRNSCLENPMDRGAWQARVHGVARVSHDLATKSPPPKWGQSSTQLRGE